MPDRLGVSMRWLLLLLIVLALGFAGRDEMIDEELEARQTAEIMVLAQQWDLRK